MQKKKNLFRIQFCDKCQKKARHPAVSQSHAFLPQAGFISQHSNCTYFSRKIEEVQSTKEFH